jgi:hypothetical protein
MTGGLCRVTNPGDYTVVITNLDGFLNVATNLYPEIVNFRTK